ncbi:MAG: hypothetical protein R3220_12915 [Balneolaceae bacterium]|nr:hypothetical protein [Balneolaceae bacterium]
MKKLTISFLLLLFSATFLPLQAQTSDAHDQLKAEINDMVENVKKAETAVEKREILNTSFDDLIATFNRVQSMDRVPESDKKALADFKNDIQDKKDELNGTNGYERVPDSELNDFAQFVQQDLEQADRYVTISITTALLIILILLLL